MKDKLSRLGKHVNRLKPAPSSDAPTAATATAATASTPLAAMTIIHSLFDLAKVLIERTSASPPPRPHEATSPESCASPSHHVHE
jgi:hypothetical protein